MKEFELYLALKKSLKILGMDVYGEVSLGYGSAIDLVGVKSNKLIGIELKRSNSKSLLSQASRTKKYCHITFVATPVDPTEEFIEKLRRYGVGFIKMTYNGSDKGADVEIVLRPKEQTPRKKLILHPYYKSQIGGVSVQSGPQRRTIFQQLTIDIEAYLKARIGKAVNRKEIYAWVRAYCIGQVTSRKMSNVIKISENVIMYKNCATYFEKYETRLSLKGQNLIAERAIENTRQIV